MAADSNFLSNLGVLGQTPIVPSKKGPVRPSQSDPDFMRNIGAFGSQSSPKPAASAPADQSFMQNIGAFSSSPRAEDPMKMMMREAGRTDVNRGLLDDGSFGFKDVYGRALVNGKVQETNVALVPDSTVYSGRNDARTSPTGVAQKGTNMSRSFNDLLATTDTSGYQPFSSNQLPTTASNPFSAQPPKTQSFETEAESYTGNSLANFGGDGSEAFAQSRERTDNDAFNPSATRIEGGSDRKAGGSLADALNDKAGIDSYMDKFSSGDQERAANRAFLDTKGSMAGLRAKEAVNGVVYAGGQHYVAGKSGDDKAVAINRSAARDISNGDETSAGASQKAQDFLAKKTSDTIAATQQAPTVLEDGAKNQAFKQDTPIASQMPSDIGGKTEYYANNDNVDTSFGSPKGFKSGFKRIDTSMNSPFG